MANATTKKEPEKLIYKQMIKVMKETEAISKDRQNQQQRYQFRGIDDVYNMLHSVFAKNGIITIPTVLEQKTEKIKSSTGKDMIGRIVKVVYRFVAEDGSFISSVMHGEAFDMGDKATNKAMSAAHKYCLLQTFCIPTDEPKDSENDSPEVKHNGNDKEKPKAAQKTGKKRTQPPSEPRTQPPATDGTEEPPPIEKADESDFESKTAPPSRFDTAVKMTIKGERTNLSYSEALKHFQTAKKFLGDKLYYKTLGECGYEKSDEVPFKNLDTVYHALLNAYNASRSDFS